MGLWEKKCTAISHAILTAARPNSFRSPLQIGLDIHLSQKYGSKHLLNILSSLGLCAPYAEAALFQVSALLHPDTESQTDLFTQFVYDNADVNICTIDGFNTFHSMGGIQCFTPSPSFSTSDQPIKRLAKVPPASAVGQFGYIPIKIYERNGNTGLMNVTVQDLLNINPISASVSVSARELQWLYGKFQKKHEWLGWNGFMETSTADLHYNVSHISYLPFLNVPPNEYDTIYTVLTKSLNKSTFTMASLPPTDAAAQFPSFRTYLQVQKWLGNDLPRTDWGWTMTGNGLAPITTDKDPVPSDLLSIISCKCLKGCMTATCSCRRAGLKCSIICVSCKGLACTNSDANIDEEECDDPTDELLENFLMTDGVTLEVEES